MFSSHLNSQFVQQYQMSFVEDMHSFGHSFTRCLKVGYLKDKLMNEWMNTSKKEDRKSRDYGTYTSSIITLVKHNICPPPAQAKWLLLCSTKPEHYGWKRSIWNCGSVILEKHRIPVMRWKRLQMRNWGTDTGSRWYNGRIGCRNQIFWIRS